MKQPPLILTLQLLPETAAFFNERRKRYYPAYANRVAAHLTLFYHLPGDDPRIVESIARATLREAFDVQVTGLQQFSNGVAYTLSSAELEEWHSALQREWKELLIAKDQAPLQPHITIAGKLTAYKTQELYRQLAGMEYPQVIKGIGVEVWRYQKNSWLKEETYPFGGMKN